MELEGPPDLVIASRHGVLVQGSSKSQSSNFFVSLFSEVLSELRQSFIFHDPGGFGQYIVLRPLQPREQKGTTLYLKKSVSFL